ncbi:MAG: hypothetical protein ACRYFX_00485 [Janthinobacterium lividum]
MPSSLLTPQLILDYETMLGQEEPAERLSLLHHFPQREIIAELAGLNYRLKPRDGVDYLTSYEQQVTEMKRFLPSRELFSRYKRLFDHFNRQYNKPVIFTRATCLFAIEEILKSELAAIEPGFKMGQEKVWEAIFKYLLCVNSVISKIKDPEQEEPTFESVNPKILALNELLVPIDPIYLPYRGYCLLKYFLDSLEFDGELAAYLATTYGRTYEELVHAVMSFYMANRQKDAELDF